MVFISLSCVCRWEMWLWLCRSRLSVNDHWILYHKNIPSLVLSSSSSRNTDRTKWLCSYCTKGSFTGSANSLNPLDNESIVIVPLYSFLGSKQRLLEAKRWRRNVAGDLYMCILAIFYAHFCMKLFLDVLLSKTQNTFCGLSWPGGWGGLVIELCRIRFGFSTFSWLHSLLQIEMSLWLWWVCNIWKTISVTEHDPSCRLV